MTTVLQIIPGLGAGGAEQACIDVVGGLKAAGHVAIVVSSGGHRVDEMIKLGGRHIERDVATKNPLKMAMNAFWLASLIRANSVDVVHARSRAPAWSAYWATCMTGCAFVTTNHAAYKFSNPFKKFYNSVIVKADRIIAISEFIGAHIKRNYNVDTKRIRVIPRGIDLDRFTPEKVTEERKEALRGNWGLGNRRLVLLPSRISPIKGQNVLIDAMAKLPEEFADTVAVILGDDQGRVAYRKTLEKHINDYGLKERVRLVEHCKDMPAAYSLASLVIAPSLVPEGFGRVPVEAMAMGAPVIATSLGGYIETIKPGMNGWLVSPDDAAALAKAMVEAFSQSPEALANAAKTARRHVEALYDKRKMVADTLAVYAELAA